MTTSTQYQSIMFADVSGSSALYKRLGNEKAKQIVDDAVSFMAATTIVHDGVVVKTLGDEVMCRFDSAESASRVAIAIQQRSSREFSKLGLGIRIGIASGETLVTATDVFGDTVNDAAYVAHIARANQIVMTQTVVDELSRALMQKCQLFDRVAIKGAQQKTALYRLAWEAPQERDMATRVLPIQDITKVGEQPKLVLILNGVQTELRPENTPFFIGRDPLKVQMCIDNTFCSREHCHIEFRRGKFVLVDHSTNGTYLKESEKPIVYLRREEAPLQGAGVISIGQQIDLTKPWLIHFQQ